MNVEMAPKKARISVTSQKKMVLVLGIEMIRPAVMCAAVCNCLIDLITRKKNADTIKPAAPEV